MWVLKFPGDVETGKCHTLRERALFRLCSGCWVFVLLLRLMRFLALAAHWGLGRVARTAQRSVAVESAGGPEDGRDLHFIEPPLTGHSAFRVCGLLTSVCRR